jgi:putative oxidoreductase
MINHLIGVHPSLAMLILRLTLGIILIPHGYRKLFEKISGPRELSTGLRNIGIPAPLFFAYVVGIVEFFGGILLVAGLFTRGAALVAAIDMIVAIVKVKFKTGLLSRVMEGGWVGGYELDLALLAISLVLFIFGGGKFSFDWLFLNQ